MINCMKVPKLWMWDRAVAYCLSVSPEWYVLTWLFAVSPCDIHYFSLCFLKRRDKNYGSRALINYPAFIN